MPNKEHLEIIRQGTEVWNKWMDENYEIQLKPDLSGADLSGVDLQRAYLANVNFSRADLSAGRFYEANFSGSDLSKATLRDADLSHTDLSWANFERADLSGEKTNLWKVVCNGTNFSGANLSKANLNEAFISQGANLSGKDTNLSYADLSKAYLCGATLNQANLLEANLQNANLSDEFGAVDLSDVNLSGADLYQANLTGANLTRANLHSAYLSETNFRKANLTEADLREAHLEGANLVEATLNRAKLTGSFIYGVSVWKAQLVQTEQANLIITPEDEPVITVDDLQVAQFIYLLLNNQSIRDVIDTIAKKAVLILGRFTPVRKAVLDAIREELRKQGYLPILFDFEKPGRRNRTETVSTLAHMARFVIADITDAKSIPQELQSIVPRLPSVPVQPLLLSSQNEYGMFPDFSDYHWVLRPFLYGSLERLITSLAEVIAQAEVKAKEIEERRKALERGLSKQ